MEGDTGGWEKTLHCRGQQGKHWPGEKEPDFSQGRSWEWEVLKDVATSRGLFVLELVVGTWFERPRKKARREVRSRRGKGRQHGRRWE